MKITVVSYSLTGNNGSIAASVAAALSARHVSLSEPKARAMGTTAFDMLLGRTPRLSAIPEGLEGDDTVLFVAPVWMGMVASPLRACFARYKSKLTRYAFISLSGGADGPNSNPKLPAELTRRLGAPPASVIDLHIADLLPKEPKPKRDDTSAYRVGEADAKALTERIVAAVRAAGLA